MNPKYPVYIISKGRWESRMTSKELERINMPYHIVVEPQEFDQYAEVIDEEKILVLPFSNLGQGSIPVRNWVWEHAIETGAERHWLMDDNLYQFTRFNHNEKIAITSGTIFKVMEDFVDRYTNIAIAGLNYRAFVPARQLKPPIYINHRVYSCTLIKNSLPHRWRGRYNEDTDLCIRIMQDGWCTILFNAFLCDKALTMTMRGGNTDELYQDDGRLKMAQSLVEQHPNIVTITWKWDRWQHHVDYSQFKKNRLIKRPNINIPQGINNFGMKLVKIKAEEDQNETD